MPDASQVPDKKPTGLKTVPFTDIIRVKNSPQEAKLLKNNIHFESSKLQN